MKKIINIIHKYYDDFIIVIKSTIGFFEIKQCEKISYTKFITMFMNASKIKRNIYSLNFRYENLLIFAFPDGCLVCDGNNYEYNVCFSFSDYIKYRTWLEKELRDVIKKNSFPKKYIDKIIGIDPPN